MDVCCGNRDELSLCCDGLAVEGPSRLVKTELIFLMLVYFSKY